MVIIVWDGFRPDFLTPGLTRTLLSQAERGVRCTNARAEYPTETRVEAASYASGSHPGTHGVMGNALYIPGVYPDKAANTGDPADLARIEAATEGHLFSVPTAGEVLAEQGGMLAVVSAASSGSCLLQNHKIDAPMINWGVFRPKELEERTLERIGPPPQEDKPDAGRCNWAVEALTRVVWPDYQPQVTSLWLSDPDKTQHIHGLGSQLSRRAIHQNDERLGQVLGALDDLGWTASTNVIVCSDHGFSTAKGRERMSDLLGHEGLYDPEGAPTDVVLAGSGIYVNRGGREKVGAIVEVLRAQEWMGPIFVKSKEDLQDGLLLCEQAFVTHPRTAEIIWSPGWDDGLNEEGVRGRVRQRNVAAHGTLSPFDIRNFLAAWGPAFKQGVTSDVPCGIIDVMPTALHLLGIEAPKVWDGRVLEELLREGPDPTDVQWAREAVISERGADGRQQGIHINRLGPHRYLERGWAS